MNIDNTNLTYEFELASLGKRIKAHMVDFLVMLPFLSAMLISLFMSQKIGLIYYFLGTIIYALVFIGYRIFFAYKYGGTLGKLAVKLKIVSKKYNTLSLKDSVFREIPHTIIYILLIFNVYLMLNYFNENAETLITYDFSIYFRDLEHQEFFPNLSTYYYILSILFILFNKSKKTPHDFIANSLVVVDPRKNKSI